MNWSAWAPAIVTILGWIFTAGMIAGRIKDQEVTLEKHDGRLNAHDTKLEVHAIAITEAKAWRDGYNAGKGN